MLPLIYLKNLAEAMLENARTEMVSRLHEIQLSEFWWNFMPFFYMR